MMEDYLSGPFLAFHNDAKLQTRMLEQVDWHLAQDSVVQGEYGRGQGGNFKGCFIGCTVHGLDGDSATAFSSTAKVFKAYGFPSPLTKLCESIFEGLPAGDAPAFFAAVPKALKLGSDLSIIHWKFLAWMLEDTFAAYATDEVKAGCADALAIIRHLASGASITQERANAAADAARAAAYTADAVYAAAYTADAANAAARAAADTADAADAAYAAAYTADAVYAAAYAARAAAYAAADTAARAAAAARYQTFADKLVELIKEAAGT